MQNDEFLKKIAAVLEMDCVRETDEFASFPQFDSLSTLSIIAMLDADYGVNLSTGELLSMRTVGDIWNHAQCSKRR